MADSPFLASIVLVSLALAGVSPLMMMGLVINRVVSDRRGRRRDARREVLIGRMLDFTSGVGTMDGLREVLLPKDKALLGEAAGDLMRLVRGVERERLTGALQDLGIIATLLAQLKGGDRKHRAAACANLSFSPDPAVIGALEKTLGDPNYEVRLAAARALADLGEIKSLSRFIEGLEIGAGLESRAIMSILRDLGANAVPQLLNELDRTHADAFKLHLIEALGRIGDLRAVAPIVPFASHASVEFRATALRALGFLGDNEALPAVLRGLGDERWEVRTQAATCAGRIGAVLCVSPLKSLLDDAEWWVRLRAAEALYMLGDRGQETLVTLARDPDPGPAGKTARHVLAERNKAA